MRKLQIILTLSLFLLLITAQTTEAQTDELHNLTITVTPVPVVENQTLTVHCQSSSPLSNYSYLKHVSGERIALMNGRYVTSPADREGLLLSCRDMYHTNWSDNVKTITVFPLHITRNWSLPAERTKRCMTTKQCSLECDITTLTHPRPKWKWSSPVGGVLNKWIAMPCSRKKGEVENIKCTGSVHGLEKKLKVMWKVTWHHDKGDTSCDISSTTIVVIVVASLVFLMVTVVCVFLAWRDLKNRGVIRRAQIQASTPTQELDNVTRANKAGNMDVKGKEDEIKVQVQSEAEPQVKTEAEPQFKTGVEPQVKPEAKLQAQPVTPAKAQITA